MPLPIVPNTCDVKCVPFVRSDAQLVREGFKIANLQPNELVVELGCGDAQNLIIAATEFGAIGIGYEIDEERIAEAMRNIQRAGVEDRIKIVKESFMNAGSDLEKADLVYAYLLPSVNELIKPMLARYNTRILSMSFPFEGWQPTKLIKNRLYYYDRRKEKPEQKSVFKTFDEYLDYLREKYTPILMQNPDVVGVGIKNGKFVVLVTKETFVPLIIEGIPVVTILSKEIKAQKA